MVCHIAIKGPKKTQTKKPAGIQVAKVVATGHTELADIADTGGTAHRAVGGDDLGTRSTGSLASWVKTSEDMCLK